MKILLTGKNGQVGWELQRTLATLGTVHAFDSQQLNLSDTAALRRQISQLRPDIIVNAAAYTAVDKAESEPDNARAINTTAPAILAEESRKIGALLVHYSTDYVFDGEKTTPWLESDPTRPASVYGATKREGEEAILASGADSLILRTSWVYGLRGKNFLLTLQRLAAERDELRIVSDQFGAPTWSRSIAEATAQILAQGKDHVARHSGIYHLTCGGQTSWHGFACAFLDHPRITPIGTADYPLPARRPKNSVLDNRKLRETFHIALPHWETALRLCLDRS